jgi:SAM-dependent methyltransferase
MITGGAPARRFTAGLAWTRDGAVDVLDIGTSQRFAKELRPYERWFDGRRYVAAGYEPSREHGPYNCDRHEDIHAMTFADESFDAVLCLEVLEHVADPHTAAREICRVLRPGGRLFLTAPFVAPYHGKGESPGHDGYPDYWRFTHQGLARLFSPFAEVRVEALDGPLEVALLGFRLGALLCRAPVRALIDRLDRPKARRLTTRHLVLARRAAA